MSQDVPHATAAVIGAGPIGIEMAVALKRSGIDYLHFDSKHVGYTISWFPPLTRFFSSNERIAIGGVPLQTVDQSKATREEYLAYLRSVVLQFDLRINSYEPVVAIDRAPQGGFRLTTRPSGGERAYHVDKLILATGGTDRARRLNIPGEDLPHVSHYFGEVHPYFQKRVLIAGGKNSAVETAIRCHLAGANVVLSYRRDKLPERHIKYWMLPEINSYIKTGRIESHFLTRPVRISPTHVTLAREGAASVDVPADFVLLLVGYEQDDALFKLAGVELVGSEHAPSFDTETMETNVPNLYIAGTAVGGTQDKYRVFIENCHVHVERIMAALTGATPPKAPAPQESPES